jgi:acid phosphatase
MSTNIQHQKWPNKFWVARFSLYFCAVSALTSLLGNNAVQAQTLPHPDHIIIVVEENKSFPQIIGNSAAPYFKGLAKRGTLFTQSYGVTHPSQPNYLALFSGSTQGINSNVCPLELSRSNLASALQDKRLSFVSYSESLPEVGFEGCIHGAYMRKHNPLANWKAFKSLNLPFTTFPQDFSKLPTVALIVPDQNNDMHDGSIAQGDAWLSKNIEPLAQWVMTHNSLLIVTWDEDNGSAKNHVTTVFLGSMIKTGISSQTINHYNILRTIEEMYGLDYLGESAKVDAITGVYLETK